MLRLLREWGWWGCCPCYCFADAVAAAAAATASRSAVAQVTSCDHCLAATVDAGSSCEYSGIEPDTIDGAKFGAKPYAIYVDIYVVF